MKTVRVIEAVFVTPRVKRFTLECAFGGRLPAWSGGSHITVAPAPGAGSWRNSYSLIGTPGETAFYRIAVRKEAPARSKGGSIALHEDVQEGSLLQIGTPRNDFPLARHAKKYVLIAGGIGITPFLSQMAALKSAEIPFEMHYAFQDREHAFFHREICSGHGSSVRFYVSSEGRRLSPETILAHQPLGTHVAVCGPDSMIAAVRAAASELGWPQSHVHCEAFQPPLLFGNAPFRVWLPGLGVQAEVNEQSTLLEALEQAGVKIPSSCRVGQCGTCAVRVIAGVPDHRDRCLSEDERREGQLIACVSRCLGSELSLAVPGAVPV